MQYIAAAMRRHEPQDLALRAALTAALGLAACFQPQGKSDDTGASSSSSSSSSSSTGAAESMSPPISSSEPGTSTSGPEPTSTTTALSASAEASTYEPGTTTEVTASSSGETTASETTVVEPCTCGDGKICGPEQCDDGNQLCVNCKLRSYVFLSSTALDGGFDGKPGIAGADAICQQEAMQAGLPAANYLAWLSTGAVSPNGRFVQDDREYVLPGSLELVGDYATLTTGGPKHRIDRQANGALIAPGLPCDAGSLVWTGTDDLGSPVGGSDCAAWTVNMNTSSGTVGTFAAVGMGTWSSCKAATCEVKARLYCVAQP